MANIFQYWVYIMSNKTRSVLYIGVTNDLYRRYCEHRDGVMDGFTKKYKCHALVYYEEFDTKIEAMKREYQIKHFSRKQKEKLILSRNKI